MAILLSCRLTGLDELECNLHLNVDQDKNKTILASCIFYQVVIQSVTRPTGRSPLNRTWEGDSHVMNRIASRRKNIAKWLEEPPPNANAPKYPFCLDPKKIALACLNYII